MTLKNLKERLWKSWTWRQKLSYLREKYNYFSDSSKEMRVWKKEIEKHLQDKNIT